MIERYSLPRMASIWEDENKFRIMLEIELLVAEAQSKLGMVPQAAVARRASSSCLVVFPRRVDRHQSIKARIGTGGRVEHGGELLELFRIQTEEHLIEQHRLSALARGLQHKVRAVLAQQAGGVINEITLLRQGT